MIGGASSCLQALAQGVAAAQCRAVGGGEKIALGDGVTMRVVRFNHSGDASNPIQHFARELYRPPVADAATGGFRAGVGEDYPNGGGNRAFLFTIDRPGEQLSFFINNSASAFDLDKDILTKAGVQTDANLEVKRKLGFAGEQKFSSSMLDAVDQVAFTSVGDDCGEGFAPPSAWADAFALMQTAR